MSWIERTEMFSRTSSRSSSLSNDNNTTNIPNEDQHLNLILYGESVPLRRTRTIIHRAKGRTFRTLSLVPGLGTGGAAKLFAENTTLDLGFTVQSDEIVDNNCTNPYKLIDDTSPSTIGSTCINHRKESDSSDIVESEHSDQCISSGGANSSIETSPDNERCNLGNISRSSTCASWTTDEYSVKSDHGSTSKHDFDSNKGEWDNFWKKYNYPQYPTEIEASLPVVPIEDLQTVSSSHSSVFESSRKKNPEKKSPQIQKVIMSTEDAIEAASCARRLSEILSSAIRRSSLPCTHQDITQRNLLKLTKNVENSIPEPPPLPPSGNVVRSKSESELSAQVKITSVELQNKKLSLKPLSEDQIEIEIRPSDPFNIAALLQKVIIERRDVIAPAEDSTSGCPTYRSDWSSFD